LKLLLWLGVFFLSASWLFYIPQFTTPDILLGTVVLVLGVLCMVGGVQGLPQGYTDMKYLLLLLGLIPALLLISFPYNLGLMIITAGLVLAGAGYKRKRIQILSRGIMCSGFILLIHSIVFPLYMVLVSHGHRLDFLSGVLSPAANLLGMHTSVNHGILFVQTIQQNYPVTITWEKLGFYLFFNIFLGAVVLFWLLYSKRKFITSTAIVLITGFIYLLLRFIAVLSFYLITTDLAIFWNPLYMMLSFLPFILLLFKLVPLKNTVEHTFQIPPFTISKKQIVVLGIVFLVVFSGVCAFLFQDPGTIKPGRVLIDEYHSQWEDTLRPLDTDWYGLLSTYNYYTWAQWLDLYYTIARNTNAPLTHDLLSEYDILILKCPTQSYTTPEIESIQHFVDAGGGLYLIGDHTNVFGMNTFLNEVSERFGLRFKTDATYEINTGDLSTFSADQFYSHPILRHVTEFNFMTSCTLEPTSPLASTRIENVIIGNRLISEPGTYSTENFFRESIASPDSVFGYLLQAAAVKYGNGRVVAFTDSTVFSSFCLCTDGYQSFTLGVMDYLNRENTYAFLSILFFAVALILFLVLVFVLRHEKKPMILWMVLFAGLIAFLLAAPFCSVLTDTTYPGPVTRQDSTRICFEQEHSSYTVSVKPTATLIDATENYGTFYVWTQRIGAFPSLESNLKVALTKGDLIVFINPNKSFTETELSLLTDYLEEGGNILVMDSIVNSHSTANELIGAFGMWLTTSTDDSSIFRNASDNKSEIGIIATPYLTIAGGTPLLHNEDNDTYASMTYVENTKTGKFGTLVVVVDSYMFSDAIMGGTFTEPTQRQRSVYSVEYYLLDYLLKT
jgi:hypothetical protein